VGNSQTERLRLAALHAYRILGTGADPSFDRITDLASRIYRVPFASVSLVDENQVWFKSHFGVNVQQIDREGSPSALVVESSDDVRGGAADFARGGGSGRDASGGSSNTDQCCGGFEIGVGGPVPLFDCLKTRIV